jgi:hypothetical protein
MEGLQASRVVHHRASQHEATLFVDEVEAPFAQPILLAEVTKPELLRAAHRK